MYPWYREAQLSVGQLCSPLAGPTPIKTETNYNDCMLAVDFPNKWCKVRRECAAKPFRLDNKCSPSRTKSGSADKTRDLMPIVHGESRFSGRKTTVKTHMEPTMAARCDESGRTISLKLGTDLLEVPVPWRETIMATMVVGSFEEPPFWSPQQEEPPELSNDSTT
uniref:Uncharacterized protein n=1 Tax=Anopheles atroparvus TaxID=41427 RepID=A0A182J9L1_ANOAO